MKRRFRPISNAILSATAIATATCIMHGNESRSENQTETSASTRITFYIDDVHASFFPETDWVRENLLQNALYESMRRNKSFSIEDLVYNRDLPENPFNAIEIRILEWRRNHSGFYQFSGSANYYDSTGMKHNLGMLHGTQSSAQVFNQYDVQESFEDVVESAFRQAFRKIEKISDNPS